MIASLAPRENIATFTLSIVCVASELYSGRPAFVVSPSPVLATRSTSSCPTGEPWLGSSYGSPSLLHAENKNMPVAAKHK
ncbi:hypothetical protein, partial [Parabacteroides distasonis]|uniref:hypothetical protein n=1 Tax=Parabacteroides distasonis TaxID=823 RepID=UPI00210ECA28